MSNFRLQFLTSPYLMLLIVPALAITLFLYFRLNKKYRRTRNRVISIVLHMIVMTLCISVLSGMVFLYDIPNRENEVILLVDVSQSGELSEQERDNFVRTVINESGSDFKVGVVTFGYTQVYAAPLTFRTGNLYEQYKNAEKPDTSATDIASALRYTAGLFSNPGSAKIVLVSDGIETDGKAQTVIRSVAAEGIRVDAYCYTPRHEDEAEIVGIVTPDYNITVGDEFTLTLTVQTSYTGQAEIKLTDRFDGGEAEETTSAEFSAGTQSFEITHTFTRPGMHELQFSIEADGDTLTENNGYYSYIYLEAHNRILIIERNQDESENLQKILADEIQRPQEYEVTVRNMFESETLPDTVDELRWQYDQVILVNISNKDLQSKAGFDRILYDFVNLYGGGVFTVGGNQVDDMGETILDPSYPPEERVPLANAYNREFNQENGANSLYQRMLPVQTVDYTPPVGVVFIIDRSGSMGSEDTSSGMSKLELAKVATINCVERSLSRDRDYVGIMTLDDDYYEDVELLPLTQISLIRNSVYEIEIGGGTIFTGALDRAGAALKALSAVERKHIVLVTDGQPADQLDSYGAVISRHYNESGITCSIVSIGGSSSTNADMKTAAEEYGHGKYYQVWDVDTLPSIMKEDLEQPAIKEVDYGEFQPRIEDFTAVTSGITQQQIPMLDGYYGTKLKEGATVPLMGEFVPVYAQWKFGEGMVGSFCCDLDGFWSQKWLDSPVGVTILYNIINNLFPTEDIRPKDIDAVITENNYSNQMSIYTDLKQGEYLEVTITGPSEGAESVRSYRLDVREDGSFDSRLSFIVRDPGVHTVLIEKKNGQGEVIADRTIYKSFSYSAEYDVFVDADAGRLCLENVAKEGGGTMVESGASVYDNFVTVIHRSFDPRLAFIITAIVLFLLDIAVRKFKFKWPHEIVRDRRAKREMLEQR